MGLMLMAAAAGVLVAGGVAVQAGISPGAMRRVVVAVLVGVALGARVGGVAVAGGAWAALARPDWLPGSMQGALVGGMLAWWLATEREQRWRVADALALGAAVALAVGWLAMLVHPVVYGGLWRHGMVLPDTAGVRAPRLPVALIGSGWYVLVLLVLGGVWRFQARPGFVAWGWLVAFGVQQVVLGFGRGDAVMWLGAWRLEQVLASVGLVAGLAGMALWRWRHQA